MMCHVWPAVSSCPDGAMPMRGSWPHSTLGQHHCSLPGPPQAGPSRPPRQKRHASRPTHLSPLHSKPWTCPAWLVGLTSFLAFQCSCRWQGGTLGADPSSGGLCMLIWGLKLVWQLQVSSCVHWKAVKSCVAGASVLAYMKRKAAVLSLLFAEHLTMFAPATCV